MRVPALCVSPSQDQSGDYLALFDSSSDGRKKMASLSKASPDRTTWNILVFTSFVHSLRQPGFCFH